MRMSARPLLQLIQHLLAARHAAGGSLQLTHVKAHSDSSDRHSVGNRLADYQANLARGKRDRTFPLSLRECPLADCEHHLSIAREGGLQLIDDVRRTGVAKQRARALEHWTAITRQGALAGEGVQELGRVTVAHGSREQQCTLLHVATNSIHFHWLEDASGDSSLKQLQCEDCAQTLDLAHLLECPSPSSVAYRRQMRISFIAILALSPVARPWLARNTGLALAALLRSLFPPPPAPPYTHAVRCSVGAFTAAEANAAAKELGFVPAKEGLSALTQLRLTCLDNIHAHFTRLKLLVSA